MKIKTPYTDVLANAFKSVQAWRTLSFVLIGILLFGSVEFVRLANERTVLLIPQGMSQVKQPVTLNLGEPFSPDYLTNVAKGDAHFLLDWTPENIETQYALFVGRLTPELYKLKNEELLAESKRNREEGLTQSFYVIRNAVQGPVVTLSGTLVRSSGGREVYRGPATYIFNYTSVGNGMLQLSGVSQPGGEKQAN